MGSSRLRYAEGLVAHPPTINIRPAVANTAVLAERMGRSSTRDLMWRVRKWLASDTAA